MGCRCASRLMAPATQIRPKMMNSIWWTTRLCPPGHNQAGDDNVRDCQRQQKLPAEGHQLVITEARQRTADPDVDEDKNENLGRKPEHRQQSLANRRQKGNRRSVPSAKEQ